MTDYGLLRNSECVMRQEKSSTPFTAKLINPSLPSIDMTNTHEKLASHFHQAVAESVKRTVEFPPGVLVTVVDAHITGDALHAKGILSVLPADRAEEALTAIREFDKELKEDLVKRVRLRRTPKLHWGLDTTEEQAAEIEKLLNAAHRDEG
ncbi:hypothetical protein GF380_00295 [Candidatus Uhrbacteria bacterium]|nr:hypothetical protein [Candidatus Uhrbacteria bacterium]MBD3283857.1 hypothetical protein [Candidatus Uhrbacteria bacterium]